jgi:anti-anti-sigma factor
MNTTKLFTVKRDGATLIVALPKAAVPFADAQIQAEVQNILERLIEPSISNVVLDLGECPYFGSAILVAMLTLRNQVQEKRRQFAMCNASKDGLRILRTTGFDSTLPYFKSREEALEAVSKL